jgi:hypothetical protein
MVIFQLRCDMQIFAIFKGDGDIIFPVDAVLAKYMKDEYFVGWVLADDANRAVEKYLKGELHDGFSGKSLRKNN